MTKVFCLLLHHVDNVEIKLFRKRFSGTPDEQTT